MADVPVVLASASPRRLELLRRLGLEPEVRPPHVDETPRPGESAQALVGRLALDKALATDAPGALVIAADTTVVLDGEMLAKPDDDDDARRMLRALSGRGHAVLTGIACTFAGEHAREVVRSEVDFRHLSPAEIDWYVATGEPLDKAGAYAIQGGAGAFVTRVVGSDTNVIGLPLAQTVNLARKVGVDLLT